MFSSSLKRKLYQLFFLAPFEIFTFLLNFFKKLKKMSHMKDYLLFMSSYRQKTNVDKIFSSYIDTYEQSIELLFFIKIDEHYVISEFLYPRYIYEYFQHKRVHNIPRKSFGSSMNIILKHMNKLFALYPSFNIL